MKAQQNTEWTLLLTQGPHIDAGAITFFFSLMPIEQSAVIGNRLE